MTDKARMALESFLVEDVILTLGTLRGALEWLGQEPLQNRSGIARIDHQLGLLEDRARAVCAQLRGGDDAGENAPDTEDENLFAPYAPADDTDATAPAEPSISLETLLQDAQGRDGDTAHAFFHSRRA